MQDMVQYGHPSHLPIYVRFELGHKRNSVRRNPNVILIVSK